MTKKEADEINAIVKAAENTRRERKILQAFIDGQLQTFLDNKIWLRVASESGYTIELTAPVEALKAGLNTILTALKQQEQSAAEKMEAVKVYIKDAEQL